MRPRLLDLFSGAGGAAMGYAKAGFDVTGVDSTRQRNYPFTFIQGNALDFPLDGFDAIHASPPCQAYSSLRNSRPGSVYPDLVGRIRERLIASGVPYVIENVPNAPLREPVILCGSQFGLEVSWPGRGRFGLRKHRLFETSFPVPDAGPHDHSLEHIPVYGHSAIGHRIDLRGSGYANAARTAMGIDWMNRNELSQAVPPAFTEYIGKYLMDYLGSRRETQVS